MCGRYSLAMDLDKLDERFTFRGSGLILEPRFNIAPTQEVLTVINDGSENQARLMKWGLIPSWAKDPSIGNRMINARAETVMEKPSFRQAFRKRRCLVIADGFYEWRRAGKLKIPMRIMLKTGEPFGFAGLWETWKSGDDVVIHSCTIVTTEANSLLAPVHNRMPVILPRDAESLWLDAEDGDAGELRELLLPYDASEMEMYQVSPLVNSPRNDSENLITPI